MPPTARRPCGSTSPTSSCSGPRTGSGYDYLKADLLHRREGPAGSVRRDPRHGHPRLLDPRQLHHGRAAGPEHSDHAAEAALRGRESRGPGGCFILNSITRLVFGIGDKPPAPLYHRQHPPGARRLAAASVAFDGLVRLRLRHRAPARSWKASRRSRPARSTARAAATV